MVVTSRDIIKAAAMDIMMNREFLLSKKYGRRANDEIGATTMPMRTTHTSMMEVTTRDRSMVVSTKMTTTTINTTTKERRLRASMHKVRVIQSAEEILRRIPRPSVISQ
jgi:hypothetical protein